MDKKYINRVTDKKLSDLLKTIGAVQIVGPKWCGKTTTAEQFSASKIYLQDPDSRKRYEEIAEEKPSMLLEGEIPRLIDEWQSIPAIWDTVRHNVDRIGEPGQYILTGSVTVDYEEIMHSGAGRIAQMHMRTMSLYESGDSSGTVSISSLFRNENIEATCKLGYEDYSRLIVRGGWPAIVDKDDNAANLLIENYCKALLMTKFGKYDISRSNEFKSILKSLARNTGTSVSDVLILKDMSGKAEMATSTLKKYLRYLSEIFLIDNVPAWTPQLRSKTTIRTSDTRYLTDPSIAAYYLNAGKKNLENDPNTYGFLFENLVIRDLKVYAESMGAEIFHYRDANGLEIDAIFHSRDGNWGAFEIKLGTARIEEACRNLLKLNDLVATGKPSFLAVITSDEYAYRRKDGVYVIPLGCLKP